LSRLITTFDEVPPYRPNAIHIASDHGVSLFKTCTAEVFRPVFGFRKPRKLSCPRPARTPPSTFLFLHLHLSNSPGRRAPLPAKGVSQNPSDGKYQPMAYRLLIHSSKRGALRARKHALAEGQDSAALSAAVYKPARSALSTVVVNKSSHRANLFCDAKKPRFLRVSRRTWATILRRSGI
jgi:hypothetical protein